MYFVYEMSGLNKLLSAILVSAHSLKYLQYVHLGFEINYFKWMCLL